jgi:hypothetical protein
MVKAAQRVRRRDVKRGTAKTVKLLTGLLIVMFCELMLLLTPSVQAQPKVTDVEGVKFNANVSMADNLKSLGGKRVSVTLNSGKVFTGIVKEVGSHMLHLEKLEGKEYFDALILIQDISAIDARFRGDQR